MSATVVPLPIWPHAMTDERFELIREAKAGLNTPLKVIPSPAEPGSPGRILCFGELPPFVCESVLIAAENVDKPESIRGAIDYLLHAPAGTPGSFSEAAWLSAVMGMDVTFTRTEVYEPKPNPHNVRFL